MNRFAWRQRWRLALTYFCLLIATALSLAVPRLLGKAIDEVLVSGSFSRLVVFALVVLAVSAGRGLFAYGQQYLAESASHRVAYDLRNAFYDSLQRLSFAFHDRQQTGNLMSRATADVEAVRWYISVGLVRSIYIAVLGVGVAYILLSMNLGLALMTLAFVPFLALRTTIISRQLRQVWARVQAVTGEMTTVLQENLTGMRVVKAFGGEEYEESKFRLKTDEVAQQSYLASRLQASNSTVMSLVFTGATGLILWYGGRQVISSSLTTGELAQFILYVGMLAMPIRMIGFLANTFSRAISSGERLFQVIEAQSPVRERPDAVELGRVKGEVRFEDVSFSYNGEGSGATVQGIHIHALPGKVVALLGGPGSGKSTVAHLIPRFYDVTAGRVTLDATDIRDVTLGSLRRNVGIVMQDVFLFTSTIRENIAYGKVDATEDEIVRAAKIAQLHDFIMTLPQGYDTWVGERGVTLSGGQRQRLAIARTILLDPPVMILDDSTSSVDVGTEQLIRAALAEVMKGRTTFVIAHRLSTVKSADQIIVLQDGRIVQQGTHDTLLAEGGMYKEIYELQLKPQEESTAGVVVAGADGRGDGP